MFHHILYTITCTNSHVVYKRDVLVPSKKTCFSHKFFLTLITLKTPFCYNYLLSSLYVFSLSLFASLIASTLSSPCIIDLRRFLILFHIADDPTFSSPSYPYLCSYLLTHDNAFASSSICHV
jgi:hypothetical protein